MENRIDKAFQSGNKPLLTLFFTAGYPRKNDTVTIIREAAKSGADIIEVGMPFSDPVAEGKTIQNSSATALRNGINLDLIFEQVAEARKSVALPLILMGYVNPVMQYGIEKFCQKARDAGVDGVILPDLPVEVYVHEYRALFEQYGIYNIMLITPQTTEARVQKLDRHTQGFLYMVSSASVTGNVLNVDQEKANWFEKIRNMQRKNPVQIGFGIHDKASFDKAGEYADGIIIGSAFIRALEQAGSLEDNIRNFVTQFKNTETVQ